MVFQDQDVVIGNVGDSRAVLATRDEDNSLIAVQLTVDLKPDLPGLSLSLSYTHARTYTETLFTSSSAVNQISIKERLRNLMCEKYLITTYKKYL
jgi:serine/threonine protein phosphatase PrpC